MYLQSGVGIPALKIYVYIIPASSPPFLHLHNKGSEDSEGDSDQDYPTVQIVRLNVGEKVASLGREKNSSNYHRLGGVLLNHESLVYPGLYQLKKRLIKYDEHLISVYKSDIHRRKLLNLLAMWILPEMALDLAFLSVVCHLSVICHLSSVTIS